MRMNFTSDRKLHARQHQNWAQVCVDNGFSPFIWACEECDLPPYEKREEIKRDFYERYENANLGEKQVLACEYIRQYFSRSIEPYIMDDDIYAHPNFKEYAGYLLTTKNYKEKFADIYENLIKIFPPLVGAKNGSTTWGAMFDLEFRKSFAKQRKIKLNNF